MFFGLDLVQWLTLIGAVYVLVVQVQEYLDDHNLLLFLVPISVWMFFIVIFYVLIFLDTNKIFDFPFRFTDWSAGLRLYEVISMSSVETFRRKMRKDRIKAAMHMEMRND